MSNRLPAPPLTQGYRLEAALGQQIETAAPDLDWLNKGIFISVAGRQPVGVVYDTYPVA
jgi:Protein of unknown function (DUF3237)